MEMENVLYFVLGFVVCTFIFVGLNGLGPEVPLGTGSVTLDAAAPSDIVDSKDIILFEDMVVLRISNASLSSYAPTGSMKPLLDKGANGIRIVPNSPSQIEVGDIISFEKDGILIVHRVVEKGNDEEGIYFITKGDNNSYSDGKVRFNQIKYLTIGVIWWV